VQSGQAIFGGSEYMGGFGSVPPGGSMTIGSSLFPKIVSYIY